jgi:hypothetical protein
VTSATDRFRMLLAGALERVCVLEAVLEQRDARIAELEAELEATDEPDTMKTMEGT